MIYLVGNSETSIQYQRMDFDQFLSWERMRKAYQLDIETTYTDWWCDKVLRTVQFGDLAGNDQWVIQWSSLSQPEKDQLRSVLEDHSKLKLIHNAVFEVVVLRFHGIRITHVYDTMLCEMVLYSGKMLNDGDVESDSDYSFFSLAALASRYLSVQMDKTEQAGFNEDELNEAKVVYAAGDVRYLGTIRQEQLLQLHTADLEFVAALENEAVLAYGEITYYGMEISREKWLANEELAYPVVAQAKKRLDDLVDEDSLLRNQAMALGYLSDKDKLTINWKSPVQKRAIIEHFFPFLQDRMSKAVLEKLLRDYRSGKVTFSDDRVVPYIEAMVQGNWSMIEDAICQIDRQWLIEQGYLIPANELTINWNSQAQVLPLFRVLKKNLADLSAESMANFHFPIGRALEEYKDALKLVSTYGEAFLNKYVEPDGMVRTQFTQVVSTGRVSSKKPNMQNIPAKESVGTRYRNAFICQPGWVYVDSDFASQELVIIAEISNDPVWNKALRQGEDLHSVCAELVFPQQGWYKAAEPDCAYYKKNESDQYIKQKCKCKGHKRMRNAVKSINFGLAYGMSEFKLSSQLNIDLKEARKLIDDYFKAFPSIGATLNALGAFGVTRGYIQTISPFFRKRWFPYWSYARNYIQEHLTKIRYNSTLGSIERASKNMPIQGTAADITKLSLVLLYWEIHSNPRWKDKVKLVMQVHDQNTTICTTEVAEAWKERMHELMLDAGKFIIHSGLLGAETTISDCWTK